MDKKDSESSSSPTVDIDTTEKSASSDNIKENKNCKFLSIDDILIRNTVRRRTDVKLNVSKEYAAAMESQNLRETYQESEVCEQRTRLSFDQRTIARSDFDETYSLQQPLTMHQPFSAHNTRTDLLKEDSALTSGPKMKGHLSEAYTSSSAAGEASPEWWNHPLWRQIYDSKMLHESQTGLTKLLVPSYLMMSQHVLGTRMNFHPAQVESAPLSSAVNLVFNVEHSDEPKGTQHSVEAFPGQDVQSSEPASDEGSLTVNTALSQTSSAPSLPIPSKPKRRRQRQAYTITQLNTLEEEFKNNRYLSSEKRETMSQVLGLSENQVKAWFQNRRTKHKKQLTQHINQLSTCHQPTQRDDRPLSQTFHDPTSFVFASAQHPFTSLPMVSPIQLHGLSSILSHSYPTSTSYLSLLQKMV